MLSTRPECPQGQIVGLEFQYRMRDRVLTLRPASAGRLSQNSQPVDWLILMSRPVDFDDKTLTPGPGHH
jgi:hypothetical protein